MKKIRFVFLILPVILVALLTILVFKPVFSEPKINIYDSAQEFGSQAKAPDGRENILIILDCSYSMDDEIHGERKIQIARNVINDVLTEIPKNINMGLRVYGHKCGFFSFDGCKATDLLVPIGFKTQNIISAKLKNLDAVGWTPICYSLDQAIKNDFKNGIEKKRIILVSDGMETCGGDPCQFAIDLMKKRTDITIDVIGFDISSEPEAISQLKCTALATHGKFFTANNAAEFTENLKKTLNVTKEVQGEIFSK